jgi:hypothetical protein
MKTRKKAPFQIYLEPEQEKMIELLSLQNKKSKAAIIRLCISRYIETLPLEEDPALNIINLGASGIKDVSEKHDKYLMRFEGGKPE